VWFVYNFLFIAAIAFGVIYSIKIFRLKWGKLFLGPVLIVIPFIGYVLLYSNFSMEYIWIARVIYFSMPYALFLGGLMTLYGIGQMIEELIVALRGDIQDGDKSNDEEFEKCMSLFDENEMYVYFNKGKSKYVIDREAKKAGVFTEKYRSMEDEDGNLLHPWPE